MFARLTPLLAVLLVASAGCSSEETPSAELPARAGLFVAESDATVERTVSRLEDALDDAEGVTVVATVNHGRNAQVAQAGSLRPTHVLIFGNPLIGTPLMQINQQAGLDLPQKMLVYEDESGRTLVGFNTAEYLVARHGVGAAATLGPLTEALTEFAQVAAGPNAPARVTPAAGVARGEGIVVLESDADAGVTYDRLRRAIVSNPNLEIVAEVDHQANAQQAGFQLPPTRLIVFGNPDVETPLMRASQTVGIDLPQKMLVYQTAAGRVFVAYNDPAFLAERHEIPASLEEIGQAQTALAQLAEIATERFARQR